MLFPSYSLHILAFIVGAIPVGVLLTKAHGIDVRSIGSGNVGATNVARAAGAKLGILTLLCDVLKGSLGASLGDILSHTSNSNIAGSLGLAVVLGHCFAPVLNLRGGKVVATGPGTMLFISPIAGLSVLLVFGIVFYFPKYVSLSSIIAAASLPIFILLIHGTTDLSLVLFASLIPLVLIIRHAQNIKRLLSGQEAKFKSKKS